MQKQSVSLDALMLELGVTRCMLHALRKEAYRAGDTAMATICTSALVGDELAVRECGRVIADARAMRDEVRS